MTDQTPPVALTIAGSDPVGGAGQPADLHTFAAFGVHGTSVLTVVTTQNTAEFRSAVAMPPGVVAAQVEALLDDMTVAATKTGMLYDTAIAATVSTLARLGALPRLVVDPVLVGHRGVRFMDEAVEGYYREELFGAAEVITPNHIEAGLLLGTELETVDEIGDAARGLQELGARHVVITGGRRRSDEMVDVVASPTGVKVHRGPRVDTANVRGSGDTLSAAITAMLAHGRPAPEAIDAARRYVAAAIERAARWRLGAGPGPVAAARGLGEIEGSALD